MKTIALVAANALLLGCAASPSPGPARPSLPDGVWVGDMPFQTISADDTRTDLGPGELVIASCDGSVQVWSGDRSGNYHPVGKNYVAVAGLETHHFYFIQFDPNQPGWVEIQAYSLLQTDSDTAQVQWSRSVNNRDLSPEHGNRYFFNHGVAHMKQIRKTCDPDLVPKR
jgi:hypothetical protein